MSQPPSVQDRACGALLGTACGDALGAPFEGVPQVARDHVERWATDTATMHFTDDTAMTVVLAAHLADHGLDVDEAALAHEFAEAWSAEPDRGYGSGPPRIFRAVLDGGNWRAAAQSVYGEEGSFGNGGAMRAAPVGLVPAGLPQVAALARAQAAVTHAHPLGLDDAAVQGVAVALAVRSAGAPLDPSDLLTTLRSHAATRAFVERLTLVEEVVRAGLTPVETASRLGHDVTALASVPCALAMFLHHPDDPEAAVLAAVSAGGDADTIAAMAAMVSGARCGAEALPAQWRRRLERSEQLVSLAERIVGTV